MQCQKNSFDKKNNKFVLRLKEAEQELAGVKRHI